MITDLNAAPFCVVALALTKRRELVPLNDDVFVHVWFESALPVATSVAITDSLASTLILVKLVPPYERIFIVMDERPAKLKAGDSMYCPSRRIQ